VSHRFSTVRMAQLIVVLDGAKLVESGSHEELMAKRGQYSQLYGIQAAAYGRGARKAAAAVHADGAEHADRADSTGG